MILDIEQFFADSTPIVVSDSVDLAEGENRQLNTQLLANFFDTPMVIDEIRVQILGIGENASLQIGNWGGSVRLKLSLGRHQLTDVYVPVGCFGPTYDGGTTDNATFRAGTNSPESILSQFSDYHVGYFRWKLPRPLVVPVGMPLEAKVSRQIEGLTAVYPSDTEITVNVAYVGRTVRRALPPDVIIPIPYVGLFENIFTSASVAISDQRDLYNPFSTTLNVQRLIGRWQNIYIDTGTPSQSFISLDANGALGSSQIDFPLTRITTFSGFDITHNYLPGLSVFEANTRTLNANIEVDPGEGFIVTINATSGVPSTGAQPSPTGSNTSFVTMIGWRNEQL